MLSNIGTVSGDLSLDLLVFDCSSPARMSRAMGSVLASSASCKLAKRHRAGSLLTFIGIDLGFCPRRFAMYILDTSIRLLVLKYEILSKKIAQSATSCILIRILVPVFI